MNTWTKEQLDAEWRHIYDSRLGALCGMDEPNDIQIQLAREEADKHIAALAKEQ